MNSGYNLNFIIPQGPTGPTGPAAVTAYGGKYSNTAQTINLSAGTPAQIALPQNMPNLNTEYGTNSITITESGVYEINFFSHISVSAGTTLTQSIRANGVNIASTVTQRSLSVGSISIISGNTIVSLTEGTVLDMTIYGLLALTVSLGAGVNASLSIKKIG